MTQLLFAALVMGFLGSPHCLGMCGGVVSAFGMAMKTDDKPLKKEAMIGMYHLGRLSTYALMGAIAGALGASVFAPFAHTLFPRVLLGVSLIVAALLMMGVPFLKQIERFGLGIWEKMSPLRAKLFPLDSFTKTFGAGLLWGFLPCGLVYSALLVAVSQASVGGSMATQMAFGAVFMIFFGLGTMPMLLFAQNVVVWLNTQIKKFSLRKVSGVIMLISGVFVAYPALTHDHSAHHAHHGAHAEHQTNHAHYTEHHTHEQSDAKHGHSH